MENRRISWYSGREVDGTIKVQERWNYRKQVRDSESAWADYAESTVYLWTGVHNWRNNFQLKNQQSGISQQQFELWSEDETASAIGERGKRPENSNCNNLFNSQPIRTVHTAYWSSSNTQSHHVHHIHSFYSSRNINKWDSDKTIKPKCQATHIDGGNEEKTG